ncbi:TPA: hypothetical protein N0F65_001424 [Lagenidium giganteum]|uniref:Uncharacterized protein n=1 Tax=Lagenidium giganteum TaxID=4803 RepID=A0AAV2Z1C1_9STRA|nr:TPA: hypothetical protein N0F65_001424 [Lagenidium giganteum]
MDDVDGLDLSPMPPPRAPAARPTPLRLSGLTEARAATEVSAAVVDGGLAATCDDDGEVLRPLASPVPHPHPLANARPGRTPQFRPLPSLQRLDPAFLNRQRVQAFAELRGDVPGDENAAAELGTGTMPEQHSTKVLERMIEVVETGSGVVDVGIAELDDQERAKAATHAIEARRQQQFEEPDLSGAPSLLQQARQRKVRKQVDPKWLKQQQDESLRPVPPQDRDDERHLYESTYRVSLDELMANNFFFDERSQQRLTDYPPFYQPPPVYRKGTTGLPGCIYDSWML